MLPYSNSSYLFDASCNLRTDEFPTPPPLLSPQQPSPPNYFPLNPANFDIDCSFLNILPADNFATCPPSQPQPDQTSIAKKAPTAARKPKNSTASGSGKQRSIRTDRHSKIRTAQGLRDRRMRLSLEVARKFFGLQDLLGFDKASATVDWLITQSRSAIEQHLVHFARANANDIPYDSSTSTNGSAKRLPLKEKEVRPISLHHLLTRESRAMTRARATERTKEKKKMQVEVDNGEAGQFDHFINLLDGTNEKDEWHIGEVPDCSSLIRQEHWSNEEWTTSTFEW